MTKNLATKGLQFVICPGRFPEKSFADVYDQIYSCWHTLWQSAYAELNDNSRLPSDTFTRQDFIGAVFFDGRCQSFILFRHIDLTLAPSLEDTYFEQWSELNIQNIGKRGKNILICGNFGVHPNARRDALGIGIKDLMLGFITEIALHSKADVVISTPRKDKNIHSIVYRWGGIEVARDINWGLDVVVDLTAFYKAEILKNRAEHPDIMPQVKKLWAEKLVISEDHFENANTFLNESESTAKFRKAS